MTVYTHIDGKVVGVSMEGLSPRIENIIDTHKWNLACFHQTTDVFYKIKSGKVETIYDGHVMCDFSLL